MSYRQRSLLIQTSLILAMTASWGGFLPFSASSVQAGSEFVCALDAARIAGQYPQDIQNIKAIYQKGFQKLKSPSFAVEGERYYRLGSGQEGTVLLVIVSSGAKVARKVFTFKDCDDCDAQSKLQTVNRSFDNMSFFWAGSAARLDDLGEKVLVKVAKPTKFKRHRLVYDLEYAEGVRLDWILEDKRISRAYRNEIKKRFDEGVLNLIEKLKRVYPDDPISVEKGTEGTIHVAFPGRLRSLTFAAYNTIFNPDTLQMTLVDPE